MAITPEAPTAKPVYRPLAQLARELEVHAGTLMRWILRGVLLSDGSRLKLAATRFPGAWKTTDLAVREFLDRLTVDRVGADSASSAIATPAQRRHEIERAERELQAAGF